MATPIQELELLTEQKYGLPEGILSSVRQQETGGKQDYIDDPTKPHYPTGRTQTGTVSSAFGPYGILESTAKQPGYGTAPLRDKSLESQVDFAASYLAGRTKSAGSLSAGLAGYGEGPKYAEQVLNRIGETTTMATPTAPAAPAGSNIDSMAATNIARNDATASALDSFQREIQGVYQTAAGIRESQATATQTVKTVELMATARAQATGAKVAAELGVDPNSANYILNKVAAQFNTNSERAQKFADRIANAADPTNIFENPLTYIRDLVFQDFNVAGQRSAEAAAARAKDQFIGLNNMVQEVAQTQNAVKQSVTTETAKLAAQAAADDIRMQGLQLNIDAIKTNSEGVVRVAALRNNNMDIALRARDQQLQEQNIAVARQNSSLQAESLRLALEERTERVNLKKEDAETRENMFNTVNVGRQLSNLPPFRSFNEMQTAAKMNPKLQDTISQQYTAGLTAQQTGVATLGATPYEAIKYVTESGAKISDGRSKVLGFVDRMKNELLGNPTAMAGIKKESELANTINTTAITAATKMSANITSGSGNIYAPPPAAVFLQDAEFGKTYIAKNILAPGVELGGDTVNFSSTVGKLVEDARAGKITMQQADSELGFLADKVKGYNNSLYRYNATAGIPDMKTVNVALDDTGSFSNLINESAGRVAKVSPFGALTSTLFGGTNETIVDISNPVQRSAYLNKRMAQNIPPVIREQAVVRNSSKTGR